MKAEWQALKTAIDHLVITANSREAGAAYVARLLGVPPQAGGEHPRMGTHNSLVRLGDAAYLEIIAANPQAPPPSRPRWFDLDHAPASGRPRLATWVVRTSDIRAALERVPVPLGPVEAMTRDALAWLITIPPDGSLPLDGAAPCLIQWISRQHPTSALPESGCWLEGLEIRHPQWQLLKTFLAEIGLEGPLTLAAPASGRPPGLVARIGTPEGMCILGEP